MDTKKDMRQVNCWRIFIPIMMGVLLQFLPMQFVLATPTVPVIVAVAELDDMADRIEALGTLRAKESVTLTATVTDTITMINFDDGQRVKAGDVLAEMTSAEEHALLEEELSKFEEAKKQLMRIEKLLDEEAIPQTLLDQQNRDFKAAQARLRQVESRLRDRLIIAPFSGVVGLRNISIGALVEPGDPITTLDDDSVMKLDFPVPAIFLESLSIGLAIEARKAADDEKIFSGVISSIDSRVDVTTRSITARALIDNNDRSLKPGMLMRVELLKNPRKALFVPEQAIIPIGTSTFVYKITNSSGSDIAEKTPVTVGGRKAGVAEILEGLAPGDLVVVHGSLKLRPNTEVSIRAVDDGTKTLEQLLRRDGGVDTK